MINFLKRKSMAITESAILAIVLLQIIMPMWLDFITGMIILGIVYGSNKLEKP